MLWLYACKYKYESTVKYSDEKRTIINKIIMIIWILYHYFTHKNIKMKDIQIFNETLKYWK